MILYVKTTNDISGNPRRGWVVKDPDSLELVYIDEGHNGEHALTEWCLDNGHSGMNAEPLMTVFVQPQEWRRIKREYTRK